MEAACESKGRFFETIVVVNFLESLPRKQQPVEKLKKDDLSHNFRIRKSYRRKAQFGNSLTVEILNSFYIVCNGNLEEIYRSVAGSQTTQRPSTWKPFDIHRECPQRNLPLEKLLTFTENVLKNLPLEKHLTFRRSVPRNLPWDKDFPGIKKTQENLG